MDQTFHFYMCQIKVYGMYKFLINMPLFVVLKLVLFEGTGKTKNSFLVNQQFANIFQGYFQKSNFALFTLESLTEILKQIQMVT